MKNVAVSLMAILFAACSGNKSPHSLQQEKEDLSAKGLLQGIWLDDETESPLMRVEGDTIYYADAQSTPIAFKIMRDILYTYEMIPLITRLISRENIYFGFIPLRIM